MNGVCYATYGSIVVASILGIELELVVELVQDYRSALEQMVQAHSLVEEPKSLKRFSTTEFNLFHTIILLFGTI